MATTLIRTGERPHVKVPGAGEAADVLSEAICGAQNVRATLRWLRPGDRLDTERRAATHQLVYVMDGRGTITLDGKDYPVGKGAGVYCGPGETAGVAPTGGEMKLFHLVVPEVADRG
jgi:quercetin dioxygenase-like cupin family protein